MGRSKLVQPYRGCSIAPLTMLAGVLGLADSTEAQPNPHASSPLPHLHAHAQRGDEAGVT